MNQITDLDGIIGRTVAMVADSGYNAILIVFTDGTFMQLDAYDGDGNEARVDCDTTFMKGLNRFREEDMIRLGFMTEEEAEERRRQREEKKLRNYDRYERELFERLKAKFEPA